MHRERFDYRAVAGLALVGVGIVSTLGIITAEALYPGYSTADHTISALGAASGPDGTVQPAATIFNGAMALSGLLAFVAAVAIHRVYEQAVLSVVLAFTALGVAGVGVFPAQYTVPHYVAALLAFGGGGLSAILSARVIRSALRYVSVVLGVVALVALVGFVVIGGATALGIGGIERWISYPVQIWVIAFGGYLLGGLDATGRGE